MFFLGENYRATAAYDRGLINDIYGINSFEEDIEKRINQLVSCQSQVTSVFDCLNIHEQSSSDLNLVICKACFLVH